LLKPVDCTSWDLEATSAPIPETREEMENNEDDKAEIHNKEDNAYEKTRYKDAVMIPLYRPHWDTGQWVRMW
jgi:hypothetical protein